MKFVDQVLGWVAGERTPLDPREDASGSRAGFIVVATSEGSWKPELLEKANPDRLQTLLDRPLGIESAVPSS